MNKLLKLAALAPALAVLALAGLAAPAVAQGAEKAQTQTESGFRSGIVITKKEGRLALWTKKGREVFVLNDSTLMPQRPVGEGSLVVVRETTPGSKVAERVILVDQEVWVEGKGIRERAIIGRFDGAVTSPHQMIIRTQQGKHAFVIDPKTFRQPFPKPNQRVALTYRVVSTKPPSYMATGLVLLPDTFDESPVKISYQDIPKPAPAPTPEPAPAPVEAPEPMVTLPQTASQSPMVALVGLLLIAGGLVSRFWR